MTSRRVRRLRPFAVLGLVAVLAAAGVLVLSRGHSDRPPQTAGTAETTASAGDPTLSSSETVRVIPSVRGSDDATASVVLPEGSDTEDGYPTRFPSSDLGAVAAQAALAQAQIGFDYDQAAKAARIYAAPADHRALVERSHAAVQMRRRRAGAPATGAVPASAAYAMTPVAFTVSAFDKGLDRDCFVVNLLSYVTLTTTDGASRDSLYAGTQLYEWVEGDWKVVDASQADLARLAAQGQPPAAVPGTPEFEQAGWTLIRGDYQ